MADTNDKFQEFYDQYKNLILKVVYDMTKDYYLAQDICQETFIKLYGYQDRVDEKRVKAWLLVVAGNKVRDHYRKGGRFKEILDEDNLLMEAHEHESCIDAHLRELGVRDLHMRMLEHLRREHEDWYEILILTEYLEVPRKVVAGQRGIALSTVDLHLRKAKEWLVKNYKKEFEDL